MGIESPVHLVFIAAVALIVLGPKRLPALARALGQGIREFRGALEEGGMIGRAPTPSAPDSPALTPPGPPLAPPALPLAPGAQAPAPDAPPPDAQAPAPAAQTPTPDAQAPAPAAQTPTPDAQASTQSSPPDAQTESRS
jgi:TatA/E family protein of Tat protein translocase